MICKIIPIKQAGGVRDCWEYITDENKVISIQKKDNTLHKTTIDTSLLNITAEEYMLGKMDFNSVLAYMENGEKTHRSENAQEKYISGYLCNPETALEEFMDTKIENLLKQNKKPDDETGNAAYHIIQSFPEDLDISDEEVHRCGRELCEKLGVHQAVICSHVHPVINEDGEVSGRCKHNHILINSHIHQNKLDPEKPNVYKYNNCKSTYTQLRQWNDEIAMEHGLPIIREPHTEKPYSWLKSREENKGTSWIQQVAKDIKNTMRFCSDWEEFKKQMAEQGYHIRETDKNITYYTPNHTEAHKQQVREKGLGCEYTKEFLQNYWNTINQARGAMNVAENRESKVPLLEALVDQYKDNLFVEVRCTGMNGNYFLDFQVQNPRRTVNTKTLYTYFDAEKTYQISTADHMPIAEVTGQDLFDYYEQLQKKKETSRGQEESKPNNRPYYSDPTKRNTHTGKPYRISCWDNTGRPRTNIELICILARVIIKREHAQTTQPTRSTSGPIKFHDEDGKVIYASTDWKLQNMYDTMVMAKDMGLENSFDVDKKLDRAGKEVARTRKQLKSLIEKHNQMKTISENIERLEAVHNVCETIYNMPDGTEKNTAQQQHAAELEQYTVAKRYLHLKNINTENQITDFKSRFASITSHLEEVEQDLQAINEEYRKLKRIEYNLTMAQNNYYCYGPEHPSLSEQPKEQPSEEKQNINLE